jgi:hypothetical protein
MLRSFTDHVKLVNKRYRGGKSKSGVKEYEEEEPGVRIQESGGHGYGNSGSEEWWSVITRSFSKHLNIGACRLDRMGKR